MIWKLSFARYIVSLRKFSTLKIFRMLGYFRTVYLLSFQYNFFVLLSTLEHTVYNLKPDLSCTKTHCFLSQTKIFLYRLFKKCFKFSLFKWWKIFFLSLKWNFSLFISFYFHWKNKLLQKNQNTGSKKNFKIYNPTYLPIIF